MKNEMLTRAISGIDDDIIAEASESTKPHRMRKIMTYVAACACFVLVLSAVWVSQHGTEYKISVYGNTVSETPVALDTHDTSTDSSRAAQDIISVPLDIEKSGDMKISAIDGTVAITSGNDGFIIYAGESRTVSGASLIFWNIPSPDKGKTYNIGMDDIIITLSFSEENDTWQIQKNN